MSKYKQINIFPKGGTNLASIRQEIDSLALDKVAKLGMRIGFSCLGISLIVLGISFRKLPPEVPLFYSRPYGNEQLAPRWALSLVPLISLGFQVIGLRGAGKVLEEDKLLAQILVWGGSVMSVMGLITIWQIVRLVG